MSSSDLTTTTELRLQLSSLGLKNIADNLDDFLARTIQKKLSPFRSSNSSPVSKSTTKGDEVSNDGLNAPKSAASNPSPTSIGTGPRKSTAAPSNPP